MHCLRRLGYLVYVRFNRYSLLSVLINESNCTCICVDINILVSDEDNEV